MDTIVLRYIAHNGSTQLLEEEIEHLPGIGTNISNNALRDSSCTGFFVVVDVSGEVKAGNIFYSVAALETNKEIYTKGLEDLVLQLTT